MNALRVLLLLGLAGHVAPSAAQHEGHGTPPAEPPVDPHAHHAEAARPAIPQPTDADRAAAFPDLGGMSAQSHMAPGIQWWLLADRLEWQDADTGSALAWDVGGWIGGDFDRLWLRSEGERVDGSTRADVELLYGRAAARWWEVVAGARHDTGSGPSRDWAAIGVQSLAPYRIHVETTAYLGGAGRTAMRLEAASELRLATRWVLQPRIELNLYGEDDPVTGIGSGLSRADAGLRLRYEIRRELAPYVGVSWHALYGNTADYARDAGEDVEDARFVAGLRAWF